MDEDRQCEEKEVVKQANSYVILNGDAQPGWITHDLAMYEIVDAE
jgi:hypothetical protein